mmetsp:Transcript_25415/g.55908  ORF Transcript_25415/g.55908 Transcript_25415/m.55908 type:complete len:401 (-) Transcript_25415:124-1326(-)
MPLAIDLTQIASAIDGNLTDLAQRIVLRSARLRILGPRSTALLALARHLAIPYAAWVAGLVALAPRAGAPFANAITSASPCVGWPGIRAGPFWVGAGDASSLSPVAAGRRALAPVADSPATLKLMGHAPRNHHLAIGHRHWNGPPAAIRSLLADHLAERLGALAGLMALPLALGLRADRRALHVDIVAMELALGLSALGLALRCSAVQSLPTIRAQILLRAKHCAVGLAAVDVACLVGLIGGLRAPGVADRHLTMGLAVLLTHRLSAVPGTMGHAALPHAQRDDGGHRGAADVPGRRRRSCRRVLAQALNCARLHLHVHVEQCPVRQPPCTSPQRGVEVELPVQWRVNRDPLAGRGLVVTLIDGGNILGGQFFVVPPEDARLRASQTQNNQRSPHPLELW